MKNIEAFEKVNKDLSFEEQGLNSSLYWAYKNSQEVGNETIDLNEVIWERDIEPMINFCRENGLSQITISSNFSGLISTLSGFEKHGCKMGGLTEVKARYTEFKTGKNQIIPAIIINL